MRSPGPDLSSGLPAKAESLITVAPAQPFWTENLLFAFYDPDLDIGFWLHLGTIPNDWTMWEERVLVFLPAGKGSLTMWSFHRTTPERRPAAAGLEFRCIDPFRKWKVRFDGYAVHTSDDQMIAGTAPPGERRRLVIELDIECATPVWDAQASSSSPLGTGGMRNQNWAKEHYEQLFRATGSITIGTNDHPFVGTGWRDHSRGPRGGGTGDEWGGHLIMGGLFPSGRGFVVSRYWTPEGRINLEGAGVIDEHGLLHFAKVEQVPRVKSFEMAGESLPVALSWDEGRLDLECITRRSLWTPMRKKYAAAVDMTGSGFNYALNFSHCSWDEEDAYVYSERSDMLNSPAQELWYGER